jgi:hypothetical protein
VSRKSPGFAEIPRKPNKTKDLLEIGFVPQTIFRASQTSRAAQYAQATTSLSDRFRAVVPRTFGTVPLRQGGPGWPKLSRKSPRSAKSFAGYLKQTGYKKMGSLLQGLAAPSKRRILHNPA